MSGLLIAAPLVLIAVYFVLAVRMVPRALGGGHFPERIRALGRVGPSEVLRATYRSVFLILVGLGVLIVAINSYGQHIAYQASQPCGELVSTDCRLTEELIVTHVSVRSARSGDNTEVSFAGDHGSATFRSDDVPAASITVGGAVTAEVWRGEVTAITINGKMHESFATQSDAWIGIAAGLLLALLGITWLITDVADESFAAASGLVSETFVSPVLRRSALYVLLPVFGGLLASLGLAYVALSVGSDSTANTFAAIYFIGGLLATPVIVLVFVSWFARAYSNLTALGVETRHSGWFVIAAMLVPPLSLFMPYRLLAEVVRNTDAGISDSVLKSWWGCALAWLGLTAVGVSISSPDTRDSSWPNQLSNGMLIASVVVGLVAIWLTMRLIFEIDRAESSVAHRRATPPS